MKFLDKLRVFKRLRELEDGGGLHSKDIAELAENAGDDRCALRPMLHAIDHRLLALESRLICARCGGQFDNTRRESGPLLMERGEGAGRSRLVVCFGCEPYVKRNGWRRAKPPIAKPEGATA